jgi:hypothetical protein
MVLVTITCRQDQIRNERGGGSMDPPSLRFGPGSRRVVRFMSRPFNTGEIPVGNPLNSMQSGTQSRSERFKKKKKNLLTLPGIDPRLLCHPPCNLFIIMSDVSKKVT